MTFKEAQDQARTLAETHQALYIAIDDGDRSSCVRMGDYVSGIYAYDHRTDPYCQMAFNDKLAMMFRRQQ